MAGSLGVAPELAPLPALVPLSALSLDELELEDDGLDGAGVAGVVVLRLELIEPDGELGELGDATTRCCRVPDVARSAPRSQAAIRLAPKCYGNCHCESLELHVLPP